MGLFRHILLIILSVAALPAFSQQGGSTESMDSLLIGAPIFLASSSVSPSVQAGNQLGMWEVWQVTDSGIWLISFQEGMHALPAIPLSGSDSLRSDRVIRVVMPQITEENSAAMPIEEIVPVPLSWIDWLPQVLAGLGAIAWALVWLGGIVSRYGPTKRRLPPASPYAVAQAKLASIQESSSQSEKYGQTKAILTAYLSEQFDLPVKSSSVNELSGLPYPAGFPTQDFQSLLSIMKTQDMARYAGGSPDAATVQQFRALSTKLIEGTKNLRVRDVKRELHLYGQAAGVIRRVIAGLLDLLPPFALVFGLLEWPGLLANLEDGWNSPSHIWALGIALIAAMVIRTVSALFTETTSWAATPGMRCLRMAVVPQQNIRPWAWLLASLPLFLGHVGILFSSDKSLADLLSRSSIRHYPKPHA